MDVDTVVWPLDRRRAGRCAEETCKAGGWMDGWVEGEREGEVLFYQVKYFYSNHSE